MERLRTSRSPLREIFAEAAAQPCTRFWVSEERAILVMKQMMRGESIETMNPKKQEMYREIYGRVCRIMEREPGYSLIDATCEAVNSPAPEFYLTAKSAKVIIYQIRRRGGGR